MSGQTSSPPISAATVQLDSENPWPGLVPYAEEHVAFFYGRDEEAEELFRRVKRKAFFLLFGQSGLGKTSLLNASLYPKLRSAGFLPIDLRLDFQASEPFESQMLRQVIGIIRSEVPNLILPRPDESLWFWFHRKDVTYRRSDGGPIIPVLVFDQFEELFTIGRETDEVRASIESFLYAVADLVENRVPASLNSLLESDPDIARQLVFGRQDYRVLISMREDYIANLDSLAPAMCSLAENRMRLLQMNGAQALQAINGPGSAIVEPAISRKIVRFVATTHRPISAFAARKMSGTWEDLERLRVDPSLLSLVCRELNRRRQQQGLSQLTDELLSGTGALESILREFYERCIGDQPLSVREFVEDELLTESGFRETVAVERAERMLAQRKAEPSAINLLVDRRLLRYEERLEIRRVELAHDVLTGVIKSSRDERLSRQGSKALIEAGEDKLTDGTYLQAAVYFAAAYKLLDDVSTVTERLQRDLIKSSKALANQILILKGHTNWVTSAAFSADGKKLVTASWDKKIRLWDVSSGTSNDLATMPGKGLSVSFSPDGTRVVAGCWNGYGYVWDVDGNLVATLDGHRGRVNYAAFSPDGKRIVTASDDSTMRVWLLDGTQILREEHTDFVKSAVYSQDGKAILTAGYDGTVKIWDSSSCQLLRTINAAKEGQTELNFAAISPDRESVATVGLGTEVILWDLDGRKIESLPGHRRRINHVQFDHSGRLLVTASDDGTAKVWDIAHAELWISMERHKGRVLSAVFSSDDDFLVTTSDDRTARLWSTRLQEETFSELVTKIEQEAPWRIVNGRLVEK